VLEGSNLANEAIEMKQAVEGAEGGRADPDEQQVVTKSRAEIMDRLAKSNFVVCPDNSEDLASITHLLLTISL